MNRLQLVEDEIGRKLAEAERSGELKSAKGYGEPLAEEAGWAETPDALRMPFKILKDAGVVPHEVEMLHERAALRQEIEATADESQLSALRGKLSLLEQRIALRLEALRAQS